MKALPTILTAAVVSFGVATVSGTASPAPDRHGVGGGVTSVKPLAAASGPSAADVNRAQSRAISDLKNQVAQMKSVQRDVIGVVNANADELDRWEACTVDPLYLEFDDTGAVVSSAGMGGPSEFIVTSFDEGCLEDAS